MTSPASDERARPLLQFRGGTLAMFIPFGVMLAGVLWLGVTGVAIPEAYWPVMLLALFVGLVLARDETRYVDALVAGMASPMLGIMLLAWFLAGIFGRLLTHTGLIDGLIWLALSTGLSANWFPLATFLIASGFSLATGTSIGTMVAATPILFPAGHALGADPLMTIGAIIGGAFVGDNLAPISDTTIVSAYSQGTDVPTVVRTRLRYAAVSAVFTLTIYVAIAFFSTPIATAPAGTLTASPRGLIMLVVPALVMVLILRGRNLVTALMWALVAGFTIGLVSGTLTPAALVHIDAKTFKVDGVIVEGIQNMVGMAVFTMFLMALSSTLQAAGLIEWLMRRAERFATTPTRAEVAIVGATLTLNGMTGAGTPSMIILGPFVRQLGHKFRIAPWRRGNLLDACSTSLIGFVPYGVSVLIPFAIAAGSLSEKGIPVTFTPVDLMPYPFYCWGLMLTTIFAAVSGWGREFMTEEQYVAEARVLSDSGARAGEV